MLGTQCYLLSGSASAAPQFSPLDRTALWCCSHSQVLPGLRLRPKPSGSSYPLSALMLYLPTPPALHHTHYLSTTPPPHTTPDSSFLPQMPVCSVPLWKVNFCASLRSQLNDHLLSAAASFESPGAKTTSPVCVEKLLKCSTISFSSDSSGQSV